MYLRETRATDRQGRSVSYLQLAHNRRNPLTGAPTAEIIHNFGRADRVDREGLARLVRSISRFLEPGAAVAATAQSGVEVVESRPLGGALVLDHLWHQLGIDRALKRLLAGRKLDPRVERVLFALVANRALEPLSKLAGTGMIHRMGRSSSRRRGMRVREKGGAGLWILWTVAVPAMASRRLPRPHAHPP